MNFSSYDDEALEALRVEVVAEQTRRWTLTQASAQLDSLTRSVLAANGVTEGTEWVQPTDPTTSFPKGWTVTHDGRSWVSTRSGNMVEPGSGPGWDEVDS
ncbi:hypothetical protein ACMZ29_18030 [Brevibacterium casei]|uniref:hypothetical protein n=1 Tax=Brevibacterium casei TaxID=33889 RepID=UPI0039EFAEB6